MDGGEGARADGEPAAGRPTGASEGENRTLSWVKRERSPSRDESLGNKNKKVRQRQVWTTVSVHANEKEAEKACRSTGTCEWVVYDSKESMTKRFVCKRAGAPGHTDCIKTVRWKNMVEKKLYHVQLANLCPPKAAKPAPSTVSTANGSKQQVDSPTAHNATATATASMCPDNHFAPSGAGEADTEDDVRRYAAGSAGRAVLSRQNAQQQPPPPLPGSAEEVRSLRHSLRAKDELIQHLTAELAAAQNEVVHLREFAMHHWPPQQHHHAPHHAHPHHAHSFHGGMCHAPPPGHHHLHPEYAHHGHAPPAYHHGHHASFHVGGVDYHHAPVGHAPVPHSDSDPCLSRFVDQLFSGAPHGGIPRAPNTVGLGPSAKAVCE